jgi:polar amino acid transport system substrate-binding protein
MRNRCVYGALWGALLLVAPEAGAFEFLSGNIPPFSIAEGERKGFVRDIVAEMAKLAGVEFKVTYHPWPKSQELAKTAPNTGIFPLARTKEREPHYQWIQKLWDMDVVFATAPGKPKVAGIDAAKALARVGVRQGSPMVKDLQGRGFTNLVIVKTPAENARALAEGTIDAWYAPKPEIAFNWAILKLAGQPGYGFVTESVQLYVAASKNSPELDVTKWQAAFATLKANGTIDRIIASYLGK